MSRSDSHQPIDVRRRAIAACFPNAWQPETFDRYFARAVTRYGDRPLVITDEATWSYEEIAARADAIARGLRRHGVGAGDHVALVMANHPAFVPLLLGAWRLGAAVIPVSYLFKAEELTYVIEQSGARVVVTMDAFRDLDYLAMLDRAAPGWRQGRVERFPELSAVVVHGAAPAGVPDVDTLEASGRADATPPPPTPVRPDDPAVVMYTSGTTGLPKGVIQTHDNLLRMAYATAYHRAFEDGRRILFALPLYHAFGLVEGLLAATIVGGAIVPQLVFDAGATLDAIARHRVTEALLVPTMSLALVEHPRAGLVDTSSLHSVLAGSAPTPVHVWQTLKAKLGVAELFTGYGMTELTSATTETAPDDGLDRLASTVGRPKAAGIAGLADRGGEIAEYRTVDPFTGTFLADGEEGELVARGPTTTRGYFGKPTETAALLLDGGWIRSGDLGRVRTDGYIELTGRSKELYKSGGELVAPKEVEEALHAHAAVSQSYVIGLPDDRWGEIGCAWVVTTASASASEEELITFCRARLAKFKVPRHVLLTEAAALPLSATGKVQKFRLIEMARVRLGRAQ